MLLGAAEGASGAPPAGPVREEAVTGTGAGTPLLDPSALGLAPQDFCPQPLQLSLGRAASRLALGLAKVRGLLLEVSSVSV